MLRTEVTVGGGCWAVEATIRRSLFYEVKRQNLTFCGQRSHPQVLLAARCSNCSTNYATDIRQLAASFFTQLAGGDSYVAVWRLPVCGRAQKMPPQNTCVKWTHAFRHSFFPFIDSELQSRIRALLGVKSLGVWIIGNSAARNLLLRLAVASRLLS